MIHIITTQALRSGIGGYYNYVMRHLDDNDYACFVDGDAMFTTYDYRQHLYEIVHNSDMPFYTCMTNRVGNRKQVVRELWNVNDIREHRRKGEQLATDRRLELQDISEGQEYSGVMTMIRKKEWEQIGGFIEDTILGVDTHLHNNLRHKKIPIMLMKGVYLYHWYRGGNLAKKDHLK